MAYAVSQRVVYGAGLTTLLIGGITAIAAGSFLLACNPLTYIGGAVLGILYPRWGK